ncbi:MAG: FAD-dependent oxidoreductase, partial [Acidobacteriaceae bacterium]|nr:FAD-dependent oxidoreductase [Acidobacteriaceae bacterium]
MTRRNFITKVAQARGYSAAFSTMHALGLLAQSEAKPLEVLPRNLGTGKKVVVLGAGISGMVAAYELRKAGFDCTVLEARERPGGRNWTIRNGSTIQFTDGSVQHCHWKEGLYLNAGPARIPSIHRTILGYCEELGIPLEVEINTSRSALMQSDCLNGGRPVEQRQVIYDTRGHVAELLAKTIHQGKLDEILTKEDGERLLAFMQTYGDLKENFSYTGSERSGYAVARGGGGGLPQLRTPLSLHDLLLANFVKGEFYEDRLDWQATMLQPVGGMDRIAYGFAAALGRHVHYQCAVKEIRRTEGGGCRVVYATAEGSIGSITGDFCICTLPVTVLQGIPSDFSQETQAALRGIVLATQYKIAWQSPRFWEREFNIYGGISFLNQPVDLVWYPSDRLFSSHGVLISGFNFETDDSGKPTSFGRLDSTAAKLEASRASVEKLHAGHGRQLEHPIYISWARIPYSLGSIANYHLDGYQAAYNQLLQSEGNIFFAGDYLSRLVGWQEGAALSAHRVV